MTEINESAALIFHFSKDKIKAEKHAELANMFAQILGVNCLVCDMDCEIIAIKHEEIINLE